MWVAHQVFKTRIEGLRSMPHLVCSIRLFVITDHHNQLCGLQILLRAPKRTDQLICCPQTRREFPGPSRSLAPLRYNIEGSITLTTLYRKRQGCVQGLLCVAVGFSTLNDNASIKARLKFRNICIVDLNSPSSHEILQVKNGRSVRGWGRYHRCYWFDYW